MNRSEPPSLLARVLLFPVFPLITLVHHRFTKLCDHVVWKMLTVLLICLYFVNAQFGFQESFRTLQEIHLESGLMKSLAETPILSQIPVPFPRVFVTGIDRQRVDFESAWWSYYCGDWRREGWYSYYTVGFLLKTPEPLLILFVLGCAVNGFLAKSSRLEMRTSLTVLAVPILVLGFVSSMTVFNHHLMSDKPMPGRYFISADRLHDRDGKLNYFLLFHPDEVIGGSTHIYDITQERIDKLAIHSAEPGSAVDLMR